MDGVRAYILKTVGQVYLRCFPDVCAAIAVPDARQSWIYFSFYLNFRVPGGRRGADTLYLHLDSEDALTVNFAPGASEVEVSIVDSILCETGMDDAPDDVSGLLTLQEVWRSKEVAIAIYQQLMPNKDLLRTWLDAESRIYHDTQQLHAQLRRASHASSN
ncbi:MAG: hypothetical protein AAFY26_18710 [Cyanobacteria bacterium J06638_22]